VVYLGGPHRRRGRAGRGIYLHDPPPGYHPPRQRRISPEQLRRDRVLLHVLTVVLVLIVVALVALFCVFVALDG
jgi:hypothetical protein